MEENQKEMESKAFEYKEDKQESQISKIELLLEVVFERFSVGFRVIGPVFAFALILFVLIVSHAFFYIIIPFWIYNFGLVFGIAMTIIGIYLMFTVLFNYTLACIVKPGSIEDLLRSKHYSDNLFSSMKDLPMNEILLNNPNHQNASTHNDYKSHNDTILLKQEESNLLVKGAISIEDDTLNNQESLDTDITPVNNKSKSNVTQIKEVNAASELYQSKLSYCKHCRIYKPLRAHHCSICRICILKMDHHCPWINNCVGQNNHRYFILFLTHLLIGSLYVCLSSLPIVINEEISKPPEFKFIVILALVAVAISVFFNFWNWLLVLKGNSTIEFFGKGSLFGNIIKDFSFISYKNNFYVVFGTKHILKAIFIPSITQLPYTGLEWTRLFYPTYSPVLTEDK